MALALAENARTSIKSAIKRATRTAQREMNSLDQDALRDLRRIYIEARNDVEARILEAGDAGGLISVERLRSLRNQLDRRLEYLGRDRDASMFDWMELAADKGTSPFKDAVVSGELDRIADEAVRFVRSFVDADGLQLSDRLWRLNEGARLSVTRAVERAVVMGHSASQAAQDYLRKGLPVPPELEAKMRGAAAGKIARDAASALMTGAGNPYANARRVFRTELNRVHGEAYRAAGFNVPGVIGTRFLLSPAHPEPDICDLHAKVNRYGLGPGVYPKGKSPWPAHPNTLSYEVVVFEDEVTDSDRAGVEDRIAWLNKQAPSIQEAVLGSRMKAAALRRGMITEGQISTPLTVLKKRWEKLGVDIEDLRPSSSVSTDTPAAKIRRSRPVGIPVSGALDIRGNKRVLNDAMAAIDQVHGDGKLPRIPVMRTQGVRQLGAYWYERGTGRPVKIDVSAKGSHRGMTAVHEIGHFLDHQAMFQPGRFASAFHTELMGDWLKVVSESGAVRQLHEMLVNPPSIALGNGRYFRASTKHVRYLLKVEEIWARAYAQYITVRSGNLRLVGELTDTLARQNSAPIKYPHQWDPEDFAPVAEAMDALFEKLGWRVRGGR